MWVVLGLLLLAAILAVIKECYCVKGENEELELKNQARAAYGLRPVPTEDVRVNFAAFK